MTTKFVAPRKVCGRCLAPAPWLINPAGGYGRAELWACTACLKGPLSGMVERLLESYPEAVASTLRIELGIGAPATGGK